MSGMTRIKSWDDWLKMDIETARGPMPRSAMIERFVRDGLMPYVKEKGYEWTGDLNRIKSALASGLHANQMRHRADSVWPTPTNGDYIKEDLEHFEMVFDSSGWDAFWDNWGGWEDVDSESQYGLERRVDIQNFVWEHLDINASKQTAVVNRIFEEEEQQEDGDNRRRHDDVYVRDMAESNEWGGYRR